MVKIIQDGRTVALLSVPRLQCKDCYFYKSGLQCHIVKGLPHCNGTKGYMEVKDEQKRIS